jgi:alkylation response protein AidB-like acyl-CoA dehydrogenase
MYGLSEADLSLQDTARAFADELIPFEVEAEHNHGDLSEGLADKHRQRAISLGLHATNIPTSAGGQGCTTLQQVLVQEQAGRVTNALGWVMGTPPAWWVDVANDVQRERWLLPTVRGEMSECYAITEENAGSDVAALEATARRDGDEYVLNGSKRFITNAGVANLYTVFAKTDPDAGHSGISAFVVEAESPGFEVARLEPKMGISGSTTGELTFDDVRVPAANLLGAEGEGFRIAMRILDRSRPGVAAQALGIAQGATDYALDYAKSRETMGRPIAQHQLIQAKLADMETECEAARGLLYRFGQMVDDGVDGAELTKASAMAKLKCGDVAMAVSTEAVQILGGYGYIKEYPVERFMRDAKITQIYEGTQEIQRLVIAREMVKESRAFLLAGVS